MLIEYSDDLIDKLSYEEAMAISAAYIREGRSTEAVRLICDTLRDQAYYDTKLMEKLHDACRPSLENQRTFKLNRWPNLGVEIVFSNDSVTFSFQKGNFSSAAAFTYFTFVKKLVSEAEQKNDLKATHKLYLYYRIFMNTLAGYIPGLISLIPHNLDYYRRRKIIEALIRLKIQLSGEVKFGRYDQQSIASIKCYLHEPQREAIRIHKENKVRLTLLSVGENVNNSTIDKVMPKVNWRQEAQFKHFISRYRRPLIIVSIHMDVHIAPVVKVNNVFDELDHHDLISISQRENIVEDGNIQLKKSEGNKLRRYRRYTPRQLSTLELVQQLRKGNASLFIYFDLPPQMGESATVDFLNTKARFTKGPAQIGIMSRTPILPLFIYRDGQTHEIVTHDLINTQPRAGESVEATTQRIMQHLVRLAEGYITRFPGQWHFVHILEQFFVGEHGAVVHL